MLLVGTDIKQYLRKAKASVRPWLMAGGGWSRLSQSSITTELAFEQYAPLIMENQSRLYFNLGIGSDLCQDQPDSVVEWMRTGRWTRTIDYGEGSADAPGFPPMPGWFKDNRDFGNIETGLRAVGFDKAEIAGIMGGNWYRFYAESFGPA